MDESTYDLARGYLRRGPIYGVRTISGIPFLVLFKTRTGSDGWTLQIIFYSLENSPDLLHKIQDL